MTVAFGEGRGVADGAQLGVNGLPRPRPQYVVVMALAVAIAVEVCIRGGRGRHGIGRLFGRVCVGVGSSTARG